MCGQGNSYEIKMIQMVPSKGEGFCESISKALNKQIREGL